MAQIVTVTPNPALDLTLEVQRLGVGEVNMAAASHFESGGKGANVARMLVHLGSEVAAVVALPRDGGASWSVGYPSQVTVIDVAVGGALRTNVAITAASGETTKVNMRGGPLTAADGAALLDAVALAARSAAWVVVGGSLPTGLATSWVSEVVAVVRGAGAKIAVDAAGDALRAAIVARADLVKPNDVEASEVVGFKVDDVASAERATTRMITDGARSVLLSLGALGAVYHAADGGPAVHVPGIAVTVRSTVGAGDVLLAALLHELGIGSSIEVALRRSVAWAAAKVQLPGTEVPRAPLVR